jgi:holo-[acyl-carrier protein] synthase
MITGIGVDACHVERMRQALERTKGLAERLFTEHELEVASSRASREASLAARFAAKEATRKALGQSIPWHDVEVVSNADRVPSLRVNGHDGLRFHVSLSHTGSSEGDVAVAVVLAESS